MDFKVCWRKRKDNIIIWRKTISLMQFIESRRAKALRDQRRVTRLFFVCDFKLTDINKNNIIVLSNEEEI